jgi:beta-glucosidase
VCNNTIAVIHSVGPVSVSWSDHPNITGIIYAGAPGEQTGPAIVDVLYGAVNPSGRLPFSIDEVESTKNSTSLYSFFP